MMTLVIIGPQVKPKDRVSRPSAAPTANAQRLRHIRYDHILVSAPASSSSVVVIDRDAYCDGRRDGRPR